MATITNDKVHDSHGTMIVGQTNIIIPLDEYNRLKQENYSLKQQLQKYTEETIAEISRLKSSNDSLQEQIIELRTQNKQLKDALIARDINIANLEAKIKEQDLKIDSRDAKIDMLIKDKEHRERTVRIGEIINRYKREIVCHVLGTNNTDKKFGDLLAGKYDYELSKDQIDRLTNYKNECGSEFKDGFSDFATYLPVFMEERHHISHPGNINNMSVEDMRADLHKYTDACGGDDIEDYKFVADMIVNKLKVLKGDHPFKSTSGSRRKHH